MGMIRCGGIYRMDTDELTLEAFKFYRKRFGRKMKQKYYGVYYSWKCEQKFENRRGGKVSCDKCAKYSKKKKKKKGEKFKKKKKKKGEKLKKKKKKKKKKK